MTPLLPALRILPVAVLLSAGTVLPSMAAAVVEVERLPEGGLQPQAATGPDGVEHLVWLAGKPSAADVFYRRRQPGSASWGEAVRVNRQPGTAIAIGTVRGARLAVGASGRVHVVWNGSAPAGPDASNGVPLWYAHGYGASPAFSEARSLLGRTRFLDGGAAVSADARRGVFVFWHGRPPGAGEGEAGRALFLARSLDDGDTFDAERPIGPGTGACACCGVSAAAGADGRLHVLFRAAREGVHRELSWVRSADRGATFTTEALQDWETASCPMSTSHVLPGASAAVLTWETRGEIQARGIGGGASIVKVSAGRGAKHPCAAVNRDGETLITWTEGTGWQRGGKLLWRLFDREGKPVGEIGHRDDLAAWNVGACLARPDGSFRVIY